MLESFAIQAEQAMLGAVLLDPAGQRLVLDLVEPEDMYRPWHGQVLTAMRRVGAGGRLPGPVDVYGQLQNDPDLPQSVARDAVPLADLMAAAPRADHASAYAVLVIEGGIRRRLHLAGSRLEQAAESGDLAAALHQSARAGHEAGACRARWLALPERLRAELAFLPDGRPGLRGEAGQGASVWQETWSLGDDAQPGRGGAGERDVGLAAQPESHGHVGKTGAGAEARALRDLVAGPSQLARVRAWLVPGHFGRAEHAAVYGVLLDMEAAGKPVDPVTVSWEAARRGLRVDQAALAGGDGPFAVASAREVHRRGVLALAGHAGQAIQADACDVGRSPRELIESANARLRAVHAGPTSSAEVRAGRRGGLVAVPRRPGPADSARRRGREAVR